MKANYNFDKARRGVVVFPTGNKVRITIRLDRDIVEWFKAKVERHGGGSYQTLLNDALRSYIDHHDQSLEDTLRKVLREELHASA